jgi:hypothetical protein
MGNSIQPAAVRPAPAPIDVRTPEEKKQAIMDHFANHWSPPYRRPNNINYEGKRIVDLVSRYSHLVKSMNKDFQRADWMYKDVEINWKIEMHFCICQLYAQTNGYRSVVTTFENNWRHSIITWLFLCDQCNTTLLEHDKRLQVEEKEAKMIKQISHLEGLVKELIAEKDKRDLATMVLSKSEPISLSLE